MRFSAGKVCEFGCYEYLYTKKLSFREMRITYPFIFKVLAESRRCLSGKIMRRRDASGGIARLGHLPHALRDKPVARSANLRYYGANATSRELIERDSRTREEYQTGGRPMRSTLLGLYFAAAMFTLGYQIHARYPSCSGFGNCSVSYTKAVIWSAIWPVIWAINWQVIPIPSR